MKRALNIGMVAAGAIFLVAVILALNAPPQKSVSERIADECQRMYRGAPQSIGQCQIEMGLRYLKDTDKEKRDAAYSRVR